jgi:benzoyl-CoA reductase subunit C
MPVTEDALAALTEVAEAPHAYAERWKRAHGRMVVGTFPMNFPAEIVHAAGALPVEVQDSRDPITAGRSLLPEFYCGYTRSLTDQVATGKLDMFDAFLCVDHCISLLGAVDGIRYTLPDRPSALTQFIASMDEPWSYTNVRERINLLREQVEEFVGVTVTPERLSNSIRLYNADRRLLREVYELRRSRGARVTAKEIQAMVKSSMVMDVEEHTRFMTEVLAERLPGREGAPARVPVHLSGHFCHAPRPELLDLIEECGALVVDDDLYTGFRFISTDVPEDGDPFDALARRYFDRNNNVPDATRVQNSADWDRYLLEAVKRSGAAGVIVLMAKFCEPHMLWYPELKKALDANHVPHLLIETEHEGLPLETVRTRVETFLERIRRQPTPALAQA